MNAFSAEITERLRGMVHPGVRDDDIAAMRHVCFIASRLLIGSGVMVCLPLALALNASFGWQHLMVLAGAILTFLAAAVVSRTGELARGVLISAIAFSVFVSGLWFMGAGWSSYAVVLLLIPPMGPLVFRAPDGLRVTMLVSVVTVAFLGFGFSDFVPGRPIDTMVGALLVIAALGLAYGYARFAMNSSLSLAARFESSLAEKNVALEAMGDLVTVHDSNGEIVRTSADAARRLGLDLDSIVGNRLFERVHVADRPAYLKALSDAARGSDAVLGRMRLRCPVKPDGDIGDEEFRWFELRARRLADATGAGVIAVFRDIDERMRNDDEREANRRAAEQAVAAKDRFLATVSHELRTPLNAIIGFSEVLSGDSIGPLDDTRRREYALIINKSGNHLLEVVNALLDISKIEAGRLSLQPEDFRLEALIESAVDMVRLRAADRRVDLAVRVEADLPQLFNDRRACRQVFINLISNAVKFTNPGGAVAVTARRTGDTVEITVDDDGIGIAAADLPRLGDPFFQAAASYDRAYEGSGLGLSIVRGLVGLMGGAMAIESAPGSGTLVTVRLPLIVNESSPRSNLVAIEARSRAPRKSSPATSSPMQVRRLA